MKEARRRYNEGNIKIMSKTVEKETVIKRYRYRKQIGFSVTMKTPRERHKEIKRER